MKIKNPVYTGFLIQMDIIMIKRNKPLLKTAVAVTSMLLAVSLAGAPLTAAAKVEDDGIYTQDGLEDYMAEVSRNKAQAVETNLDPAWPHGPAIGAAGAVVMDADSGAVLYAKNKDKQLYPASITKVMTALLAYENLKPSDTVTFSQNAVFGIEFGSSNIGMDVNQSITVDQALYGLLVASANEVAVALAERVSGSEHDFVKLMNERAAQLGCKNTHFVTTNGLHDSDHYSSAYDMALIAREAYKHPDLINYMSQSNYHFEASENQPDDFWIGNTNDFLSGEIPCEDVIGGKTGYTDQARETLVTYAERDGKHLICVIMREEPPYQFYDTIDLINYAFDNFQKIDVSEYENRFSLQSPAFLSFGNDIFGGRAPAYRIAENTTLLIPKTASFDDLTAEIIPAAYDPYGTVDPEGSPADNSEAAVNTEASVNTEAVSEADNTDGASDSSEGENAGTATTEASSSDPTADAASAGSTDSPAQQSEESSQQSDTLYAAAVPTGVNGERVLGYIHYKFHDFDLGTANILFIPASDTAAAETVASETVSSDEAQNQEGSESSDTGATSAAQVELPEGSTRTAPNPVVPREVHGIRALFFGLVHTGAHGSVYLNILFLLPLLLIAAFVLSVIFFIYSYYAMLQKRRKMSQRRAQRARRENSSYDDDIDDISSSSGRSSGKRSVRSSSRSSERPSSRGSGRSFERSSSRNSNRSSAGNSRRSSNRSSESSSRRSSERR